MTDHAPEEKSPNEKMPDALAKPEEVTTLHLIAKNTYQMAKSQKSLREWLTNKVAAERDEQEDVQQALRIAIDKGWATATLDRQVQRATVRLRYYEKLLAAVDSGYCIVPNFPVDYFAIRTGNKRPQKQYKEIRDASASQDAAFYFDAVQPRGLPIGEGHYVSPSPEVERVEGLENDPKKGKEILVKQAWTTDFNEVVFPLSAARPEVMDATALAMARNLFDAIGICPPQKQPDPLIIGKIFGSGPRWSRREASFLIAWHLDLRTL